jgi:ketosteroid isomerase-like protein
MTPDEELARAATLKFYEALEAMIAGKGLGPMKDAWHQTDRVTSGHPSGEWAQGWDEVLATWEVFAGFGHPSRCGSKVRDVRVYVYGDVAYATSTFTSSPAFGTAALACTNVLQRVNGVWKIIHHHADKSPAIGAALEKIARGEA